MTSSVDLQAAYAESGAAEVLEPRAAKCSPPVRVFSGALSWCTDTATTTKDALAMSTHPRVFDGVLIILQFDCSTWGNNTISTL